MTSRFWVGVAVGAGLAWYFGRSKHGVGGAYAGGAKGVRGRMSWSGLGRFR